MQMTFHFNFILNQYIHTNLFLTKVPKQQQLYNGKTRTQRRKAKITRRRKKNLCIASLEAANSFLGKTDIFKYNHSNKLGLPKTM